MSNRPTGTVTFLFTDIEGSTKLAQDHPDTWEKLRYRHNEILKSAIESHKGYVFEIVGDAFCAAFSTAWDALQAAMNIQKDLSSENWGEYPISVRIGLHTGKAFIQENGGYIGYTTLSRIQRLMSAGHGGQTLISQATQEMVRDELPDGTTLRDMKEHRLKDMILPEHIYQVDFPGNPVEFSPLKTLEMQLNNLPLQLTSFIGREREIAAVMSLLRNPEVRLVTLTGAGGIGKTRLSLQVAADLLDEYEQGVWFVEMASITDPDLVLPTIASTLKLKESSILTTEQVLHEHLAKRNLLLVIDNFEQVVNAAPVLSDLLMAASGIKILISSREVLHLRGEHDYPVPPLGLPEDKRNKTVAVLANYEAIALFVEIAQSANPSFVLDKNNASIVADICTRLDGLPLAIELAASRSRLLKPEVMLEMLNKSLDVLTGGGRNLPHRQQTLRGAIDWSYNLLDDAEKTSFARLGIFNGGWTFESAEAVCGKGLDMMRGIESLLDKSLIRQYDGRNGDARFTMLETIREYAFEKLTTNGELFEIQKAHAEYMGKFLRKIMDLRNGPEEIEWFAKLDDELDNLRSVVAYELKLKQPAVIFTAGRMYQYWNQRTHYREPLGWLEDGLAVAHDLSNLERAHIKSAIGTLEGEIGDKYHQKENYESALSLYQEAGDLKDIAIILNNLGNCAWSDGDLEKSGQLYEQSLAMDPDPNTWSHAMVYNNLGSLAKIHGDWQKSNDYYLHSRQICLQLGADAGVSYADWFLGRVALSQRKLNEAENHFRDESNAAWLRANPLMFRFVQGYFGYIKLLKGNYDEAERILNDSIQAILEYMRENPEVEDNWMFLDGKARLALKKGQAERAAQLFGAAWVHRDRSNNHLTEFERPDYESCIAAIRERIGDLPFDELFKKGQGLNLKDALLFAIEDIDS